MNIFKRLSGKLGFVKKPKIGKIKLTKKKIIILIAVLLAAVALVVFAIKARSGKKSEEKSYTTAYAQVGDITETISQSGVVEPYERREITSLVKGEIILSAFEEGDYVEEGETLYKIDDEDAQLQIEKAQNNIEKANIDIQETYDDINALKIYAPESGTLSGFKISEGEDVQSGSVGYITNTEAMTADIPFTSYDYGKINIGDKVTVTSALYMTSMEGTVVHKYDSVVSGTGDGASVKKVEVEITNPGALAEGTTVAAVAHTSGGDVNSSGSGEISYGSQVPVNCEVQGSKAEKVYVKNGDKVKKGQLMAELSNSSLYTTKKSKELSLKDSGLSLQSSKKSLEDYNITAPISGTVITKNSKLGDKIDNSNSQTVMMVIADMSKMKFTITVDELDIAKIEIGQKAVVTADAIETASFEGEVTNVASEGTSSGDGVTTYEVEIVINEPGELKSGMNVNADIVISEAKDAVYIPEEALMGASGSRAMVLVKKDKNSKTDKADKNTMPNGGERPENMPEGGMPNDIGKEQNGRPEGQPAMDSQPEKVAQDGNTDNKENGQSKENSQSKNEDKNTKDGAAKEGRGGGMNIPDGYEMVSVETGVSDGTNIEIISGLSEGDEIIYIASTASASNEFNMGGMPGMGGGMPGGGGGMPGGGGGMPGGGQQRGGGGMPGGGGGQRR